MLLVKTCFIQLKDSFVLFSFVFFFHSMLNIRKIVGRIHVPAYAKLVIPETETLAKVCKGDRAAFAVRLSFESKGSLLSALRIFTWPRCSSTNRGPKLRIDP